MSSGATPDPQRGTLAETPLPNLLLDLYRDRFTGTLRLERQKTLKSVDFQEGAPVYSESNLPAEALGALLMNQGLITREDQERINEHIRKKKCREGNAMLALRLLDPKQLFAALKDQLRRRIVDCFGWPDGEYALEPSSEIDPSVQPFRTDPFAIVQQGLESHWGMERMLPGLAAHMERFTRLKADAARPLKRLEADPSLRDILAKLDGYHRLGAALGSAINDPRLLSIVWSLDAADLLEHSEVSRQDEDTDSEREEELDIEVEISGVSSGQKAQATAAATNAAFNTAAKKAAVKPTEDESDKLRASILSLHENLSSLTHYEVLGIEADADPAQIKKTYFKLAKTHHPDAVVRIGLDEIASETQQVFAAIAEAFGVLSRPESRSEYDASLSGDATTFDSERLAQAETLYLKGEVLLKMGNFAGAIEFLEPAATLWPNECDYQSGYGWALYKKSPPEPEKAREHLEQAIALKPDDAVTHFRLGLLLRSIGENDASTEHLARAKAIDPNAQA